MPRLIDAELLTEHLFAHIERDKTVDDGIEKTDKEVFAFKCGWNDALKSVMENAPEGIVRCKDCAFWENKLTYHNRNGETWGDCLNLNKGPLTKGEFFCAWAERREDAKIY